MKFPSIISETRSETTPHERDVAGGIPLRVENVSKHFSGRAGVVEALQPTTIDIEAGQFVCLLGHSGCGKSTLAPAQNRRRGNSRVYRQARRGPLIPAVS